MIVIIINCKIIQITDDALYSQTEGYITTRVINKLFALIRIFLLQCSLRPSLHHRFKLNIKNSLSTLYYNKNAIQIANVFLMIILEVVRGVLMNIHFSTGAGFNSSIFGFL